MTFDEWYRKEYVGDGTTLQNNWTQRREDNMREAWEAAMKHGIAPQARAMETGCETHTEFKSSGPWCPICTANELAKLRDVAKAAKWLSDSLNGGFFRCQNCGDQEDTTDLDFAADLRAALLLLPQRDEGSK